MPTRIVGTAGHIDHGKSSLVEALTGTHPDRLKEERERGITIELGFADFEPSPGRVVSFVDVPGHERFVRHMVAGAGGVDAVLLVVAADEGVMPQTREHVAICGLLGARHGVVAVTKADLVERELREVVALEVREFLRGTFLEAEPVVAVSARTGEGLDLLRSELSALFDRVPERSVTGVARLPIDRSFVMKGFGTVVTGTLLSGRLAEGDDVEVLPQGARARIRGIQVHRRKTSEAQAGQRTAINLQGVDVAAAPRGATVGRPGTLPTTRRVWANVRLLEDSPGTLRKGGTVRFHQGTCERAARLRILREAHRGLFEAEIVLREDTVLLPGDRFILRRPAPHDTVGGGEITDVRPPRGHARATARTEGLDDPVLVRLARVGRAGRDGAGLAVELGLAPAEWRERERALESSGRLVRVGTLAFSAVAWRAVEAAVGEALNAFHAAEPLRPGITREDLRARCAADMPPDAWRALLEGLEGRGGLRLFGERVASAGHRVVLSGPDREVAEAIEARFRAAGLDPPDPKEVLDAFPGPRTARVVDLLVAEGRLVKIRDGRLFHGEALEALRNKLREFAKTSTTIDVGTFKELAGVTRKNAIPLLEQLDAERRTRRAGNVREIVTD